MKFNNFVMHVQLYMYMYDVHVHVWILNYMYSSYMYVYVHVRHLHVHVRHLHMYNVHVRLYLYNIQMFCTDTCTCICTFVLMQLITNMFNNLHFHFKLWFLFSYCCLYYWGNNSLLRGLYCRLTTGFGRGHGWSESLIAQHKTGH